MRLLTSKQAKELFSSGFEQQLIRSAYARFGDVNDVLRCNLFALIIRELIRITMARIAPDDKIRMTTWYTPYDDDKITRSDRYRFAITGHLGNDVLEKHPSIESIQVSKELAKKSELLSKYTHISEGTYTLDVDECEKFKCDIEDILLNYVDEFVVKCGNVQKVIHGIIADMIRSRIEAAIVDESDTIAAGTDIIGYDIDDYGVCDIRSEEILVSGTGNVEIAFYSESNGSRTVSGSDNYGYKFEIRIDNHSLDINVLNVKIVN